ncbi:MAG TPA: DUF4832 domain-containing protein [Polyangiaceae bacterium]|nr:DUF4832 domain-containing protein [Polyangiaceae bacterium]HNZ21934.1 DUF4832 domain-containing protein [Polyangiaceae bacterium]HOD23385.1 DUF4832 domain-containing protein [Polyangiaceae bacterium]HOE49327.1 DUF4832 domain-containing protein [Polyangiaceae bacterium]HOH00555.1 DUF4832 domain-containing protein [Polyangiaceae bacterium]
MSPLSRYSSIRMLSCVLAALPIACSSSDDASGSPTTDAGKDVSTDHAEAGSQDADPHDDSSIGDAPDSDGNTKDSTSDQEASDGDISTDAPADTLHKSYEIDTNTAFLNPERGFHGNIELTQPKANYEYVRQKGYTLARAYVRLDDYRNAPIPSAYLASLRNGLSKLREAGIKVVPRFAYNFGMEPDAPLNVVLEHIDQLTPILEEYSDVIAVLHGGFIGAWGEWHSSTHGLDSPANMKTIAEALLEALPDTRMIQVRTPGYRRHIVGSPSGQVDMFGTTSDARIGFLNDCFLSSASDAGTYLDDQTKDRSEAKDFSRYTTTGGETCSIDFGTSRQKCPTALEELADYHWDYLNSDYYGDVLNGWKSEGCYEEVARRLGYRIALESASVSSKAKLGSVLTIALKTRNDGFGKVYNPRPIDVVLRDSAGEAAIVRAVADSRTMLPLAGQSREITLSVTVPSGLASGKYRLLLSLPDASTQLENDVRYSIRLANVDMWEEATGFNDLGLTVEMEP